MQAYPVDADPGQLVRWLMAEHERSPSALKIAARRAVDVRGTATLEITPRHANDGWLLKVVVEDEAGPRVPEREKGVAAEQQIDLGTFYRQFVRAERGIATVMAEVQDAAAEGRLGRLIDAVAVDRHTGDGMP